MYVATLQEVMKYVFAFDRTHYSRWLPVHIQDILSLEGVAPSVLEEFQKGHFVVSESKNPHSCIAVDMAHENHNAVIKSTSGGLELLNRDDDGTALLRSTITLPEIHRLRQEYCYLTSTEPKKGGGKASPRISVISRPVFK